MNVWTRAGGDEPAASSRRTGRAGRILGGLVALIVLLALAVRRPARRLATPHDAVAAGRPRGTAASRSAEQRDVDSINRSERILALRAVLIVVVLVAYVVVQIHFL